MDKNLNFFLYVTEMAALVMSVWAVCIVVLMLWVVFVRKR